MALVHLDNLCAHRQAESDAGLRIHFVGHYVSLVALDRVYTLLYSPTSISQRCEQAFFAVFLMFEFDNQIGIQRMGHRARCEYGIICKEIIAEQTRESVRLVFQHEYLHLDSPTRFCELQNDSIA